MAVALFSPKRLLSRPAGAIVVDARPRTEFEVGHIPGAVWMAWEDWCAPAPAAGGSALSEPGYWGVLADPAPDVLAQRLTGLGFRNDRPVVMYADGARSKGREGRIAWMLLYLGARSVALLDGGWEGWITAGGDLSTEVAPPSPGEFTVEIQHQRRLRFPELRQAFLSGAPPMLIDTRTPAEFAGRSHRYQPRLGRLPGAISAPFTDLFDDRGRYLNRTSYLQRLSPPILQATHLVAYCEVGVRACTFALLHEIHTGISVGVFDGSFMEWALDPELPIEGG